MAGEEERDENGSEKYRHEESCGRTANTKGYFSKQLMPWVDCSLGGKRGRDSTAAIRGSLKLTISVHRGKEIYVLYGELVMLVEVDICVM